MGGNLTPHLGLSAAFRDEPGGDARRDLTDRSRLHIVEPYTVELVDVRRFPDSHLHFTHNPTESPCNDRYRMTEQSRYPIARLPRAPERKSTAAFDVVTVAGGLQNPWSLAFLPSDRMLVTERPGRLRIVAADGALSAPVNGLPVVEARGQGGLLDVALDPLFATNGLIYWSYAERAGSQNNTAVARGRLVDGAAPAVVDVRSIYHQRPSLNSGAHFGGRLVFARDGTLFVTQGDRSITEGRMQAQRLDGLLGKIVRINPDGSIPQDNPFAGRDGARPEIWSLGHRNGQAAALTRRRISCG